MKKLLRTRTHIGMLIAVLAGILALAGSWFMGLTALEAFFGGQTNPWRLVLGLMILISGPVLLGLSNNGLPRALLAGLLAPLAALIFSGFSSLLLNVLQQLHIYPRLGPATILAIVSSAVLVGASEALTRGPAQTHLPRVLRGTGLALCVSLGLELLRQALMFVILPGPIAQPEWMSWLAVVVYTTLTAANVVYLEEAGSQRGDGPSAPATAMFIALNLAALVTIIVVTVFSARAQVHI